MSRLEVACIVSVGAGVLAAALVGVAIVGKHEPDAVGVTDERTESPVDQDQRIAVTEPRPTERSDPEKPELDDVAYACRDFYVSTDRCVAALDRRYLALSPSSVTDRILKPIVPSDNAMTLRRVFDDPKGKRTAIEEAWDDTVCVAAWPPIDAPDGWSGGIRRDLVARCEADAMAEFSVLVELCATESGYARNAEFHRERAVERLDAIEDNQAYWEARAAFENEHYLKMWLAEKCRRTGPDTLAPLKEYVHTDDEFMDFLNYLGDVYSLRRGAAWLGQEWAMVQRNGPRSEMYVHALREADPLRYHVHEAYRLRGKRAALPHVLAASKLAASQKIEIDSEALFEFAGRYGLDDLEEADRAARKLLADPD